MDEMMRNEYERIINLKKNDYINRIGKLFNTNFNNYFYDTGTGKVVKLGDEEYNLLAALFSKGNDSSDFEKIFATMSNDKQNGFLDVCIKENLLKAYKPEKLNLLMTGTNLADQINYHSRQLVLEVTEKCNFRCKYCIYNEEYTGDRCFGTGVMDIETAKKSIEYIISHSDDTVSITFYGGEPLLNYNVIKESIEYSLEIGKDKIISFSITSNLTLLTKEMADFFGKVPNLSILASIDGPEDIHNASRVYSGNKPTFTDTMKGLRLLADAFRNSSNVIMINTVLVPPYEYSKIESINTFFENMDFLPNHTEIRITYPQLGTYNYNKWELMLCNEKYSFNGTLDPLKKWQLYMAKKNGLNKNRSRNIYFYSIYSILRTIDGRRRSDRPFLFYPCNGCCVPGARKIYVKTNGDIQICEKIGTSPIIGNILSGIDIKKIEDRYVKEYEKKSIFDCSKCWAINMCGNCYANCYSEAGMNIKEKEEFCSALTQTYVDNLSMYFMLVEESPEILDVLKGNIYSNP